MLVKRSDFSFLPSLMDDIFNDFSKSTTSSPAVNIKENDNAFVVEVAVPGLSKEDIKVNVENNVLTIASENHNSSEESNDNYTRKEYSYQSFKRSFNLPKDRINSEAIAANYQNGELIITLPKMEKVAPKAKLIEIQ